MRQIVIGLGNPILSDDSVGIRVARALADRRDGVDVVEVYAGGLRLMDALAGYDRAWIVDAIVTGEAPPGAVHRLSLDSLRSSRNTYCIHDMNLPTAIEMGRVLGMALPSDVRILGIEARDVETFSERLSPEVEAAIPVALELLLQEIHESEWSHAK